MKKTLIAMTLASLTAICARPQDSATATQTNTFTLASTNGLRGRFGAGVLLGEPTGLTVKYWLNETMALDGAAGCSFYDETDFDLHADFLWHPFNLIDTPAGRMPLYFGAGPRLRFQDNGEDRFGLRIPVGVSYMFNRAPVDVFLEAAPIMDVAPYVRGDFSAGIGIRYWF